MQPIKVTKADIDADLSVIWNKFVFTIAPAKPSELTTIQFAAALAFSYHAEIMNGGHYQYFENRGTEEIDAVILSLRVIGAEAFAEIATRAKARAAEHPPKHPETVDEFVAGALEGAFDDLDRAFYRTKPEITDVLEAYIKEHEAEFIERVP